MLEQVILYKHDIVHEFCTPVFFLQLFWCCYLASWTMLHTEHDVDLQTQRKSYTTCKKYRGWGNGRLYINKWIIMGCMYKHVYSCTYSITV